MSLRRLFFIGAIIGAVLSFAGCLDSPDAQSSDPQHETVTLTNAHFTQDGESTIVSGLSNGVETSVIASQVTFEDASFLGGGHSNILTCYKCICDENVCLCREVAC